MANCEKCKHYHESEHIHGYAVACSCLIVFSILHDGQCDGFDEVMYEK